MRTCDEQPDQSEAIQVTRATTLEELDQIQRLRYDVYAAEMGLELAGVDHEHKRMCEELDYEGIHLMAWLGEALVGSVRINENQVARGMESILQVSTLPRPFCYCARLYIPQEWRGGRVLPALAKASFAEFDRLNAVMAVCHCYPRVQKLYQRMGFEPYGKPFVSAGLDNLGWQRPLRCLLRPEALVVPA